MANLAMDEGKPWWTLELLLSDLRIPYSLLDSALQSLLSPPSHSRSLPPQIRRLLLLRHLLSLTDHLTNPTDETLKTLDLLLPRPPSPPSPSLCKAYASVLFYISVSTTVSASDSVRAIDRIRKYEFSVEILRPLDRMMKEFVDCGDDCVAVAKEKVVCAVKEFVEEELRIVGPPFYLLTAEMYLKEQNKNINEANRRNRSEAEEFVREQNEKTSEVVHTSSVRKDSEENQDTSEERVKYRMVVRKRKISEVNSEENQDNTSKEKHRMVLRKRKISEVNSEENQDNTSKEKHRMVLRKRKISEVNSEENQDISGKKNKSSSQNGTEKDSIGTDRINLSETNELNPDPNRSVGKNTEENSERTEMRGQENNSGKNINNPPTPHAKDANSKKKRSLRDRNPTARTFEWDESIEEMEISSSRPKRRASKRASEPIKKTRPKRKWSEEEVKALIKGVNEIGEGKWKRILEEYGDEFDDRTDVDLKDKWRNLGPYLLEVGGKWSLLLPSK